MNWSSAGEIAVMTSARIDIMAGKRNMLLIGAVGGLFPIYPAILLQQVRGGNVSIARVAAISVLSGLVVFVFARGAAKLNAGVDIEDHLRSNYSEAEQRKMIHNYDRYKSRFWSQTPLFSTEAKKLDPVICRYQKGLYLMMLKMTGGFLCFAAILSALLYFLT